MDKKTSAVHTPYARPDAYGALAVPVYHSVAFEFDDAQTMSDAFCNRIDAPDYSRVENPTHPAGAPGAGRHRSRRRHGAQLRNGCSKPFPAGRGQGLSHDDLVDLFVNKARLALNDGAMFGPGGSGFMRINVGTQRAVLREALERLRDAIS